MTKTINTIMPSFADDVVSALGAPKRAISPYEAHPIGKRHMSLTRANIRQSERFTVGDDVLEQACKLSLDITVAELSERLEYCHPPYNLTWIDWDETKRQKILVDTINKDPSKGLADIKESEQAKRIGYLISPATTQYNKESTINIPDGFYIEGFLEMETDKTFIWCPPIGTLIKPTGFNKPDWEQIHDEDESLVKDYQKILIDLKLGVPQSNVSEDNAGLFIGQLQAIMNQMGTGWWNNEVSRANKLNTIKDAVKMGGKTVDIPAPTIESITHLGITDVMDKAITSQVGSMAWTVPEDKYKEGWTAEDMADFHNRQALAMDGDLRLIIILLSLLNKQETFYSAPIKSDIRKIQHGKVTPTNEYYVLTLDTSDTHVTTYIDSATGSPKREHSVRGHWRYMKKSGKRVWVKSHRRGDAELGIIIKDYKMTGV